MILTTLLAAAGLFAGQAPAQLRSTTTEDTAEGAEILRRILVNALDDAFARKEDEDSATSVKELHGLGVVTTLWANREIVQHSRAFHLPEVGLFFAFDAALPVVYKEQEKKEPDKGAKPKDDVWERARREVRGGGEGGVFLLSRSRTTAEAEIDPKAIDQVIDLMLRTAARHAARIEGLAPQETLTIALRLSGRERTVLSSNEFDDEGKGEAHVWSSEAEGELAPGMFSFAFAGGASVREQNLVLRIALADLAGFAEGGLDSLRQRAQINRY